MSSRIEYEKRVTELLSRHYDDVKFVTMGANGLVFAAHERGVPTHSVSIKVPHEMARGGGDSAPLVRFRREAELGALLHHPNIVRMSPIRHDGDLEFFEMDTVGPMRLDRVVRAPKPPGFDRLIAIMHELGEALDHVHAQGIVHGRLRPSSVYLDGAGHVRLKGFMLREHETPPHPALTPATVGDAAYMPPEQWRDPVVDRRVDVYAAGVLAYELCTGAARVLQDGDGPPQIQPIDILPHRPLREGMPIHVNAAIRRATHRDPATRFTSVGEFARALSDADEAQGHSLPTYSPPAHAAPPTRSWLLLVLVLGVAIIAILAAVPSARDRVRRVFGVVRDVPTVSANPFDRVFSGARTVPAGTDARGTTAIPAERGDSSAARQESPRVSTAAGTSVSAGSRSARQGSAIGTTPGENPAGGDSPAATNVRDGGRENAAAAATMGVLRITADRNRPLVLINGIPRGRTPLVLSLKPGAYRVTLRGGGRFDPSDLRVQVQAADTAFAEFYAVAPPDSTGVVP